MEDFQTRQCATRTRLPSSQRAVRRSGRRRARNWNPGAEVRGPLRRATERGALPDSHSEAAAAVRARGSAVCPRPPFRRRGERCGGRGARSGSAAAEVSARPPRDRRGALPYSHPNRGGRRRLLRPPSGVVAGAAADEEARSGSTRAEVFGVGSPRDNLQRQGARHRADAVKRARRTLCSGTG
jgi:hypothetical protein